MATEAWPLVGRRDDLETVAGALRRQGSAGAVLTGPAGVGKTRLLSECLALAERAGYVTMRTAGSKLLREVPLGALLPLLPPDIGSDPATVLSSARRLLEEHTQGRRALLGVDDAHLLDDTSLWLLRQFTLAGEISLVMSTRDGEPVPDELCRFWLDETVVRLQLAPLAPDQVDVLLHRVLGAPVDRPTLMRLVDLAAGNVLFLRELVTGALEEESLQLRDGSWQATRPFSATARLKELVTARLAGLGASDREALELLAIADRLGLDDLLALAPDADLLELEARGLLRVDREQHRTIVTPAHPLHADVLSAQVPVLRGVALRRRLADRLERSGTRRRDDAVRVALWRLDAGDRADPGVLVQAARVARAAHDYHGTARLAEAALTVEPSAVAAHLVGDARYMSGDTGAADDALRTAHELAASDGDLVGISLSWIDVRFWGRGDHAGAQALAVECSEAVPEAADLLTAKRASLAIFAGQPDEAVRLLTGVAPVEPRAAVQASMALSLASAVGGAATAATAAAHEAVAASMALDAPAGLIHPVAHRFSESLATALSGCLADAATLVEDAYAMAAPERMPFVASMLALNAARVAALRGDLLQTRRWAGQAIATAAGAGQHALVRWGLAQRAVAALGCGDRVAAAADLEAIAQIAPVAAHLFDADVARAEAWLLAADGAIDDAVAILSRAATDALESGAAGLALEPAHDAVRLGGAGAGLELLTAASAVVEGTLAPALLAHARGVASNDGAALEAAAEQLEAVGASLLAAEAWASSASAWAEGSRARRAAAAAARVEHLRAGLPGVATPGLAVAPASSPLTPREREIATLVAGGLASREVAERLVVSVRTVDNHLQRVFAKLGIGRRSDLGMALGLSVEQIPHGVVATPQGEPGRPLLPTE